MKSLNERQSLALNYEFEWTERQTQLLLKSSVLKNKGFDWDMWKKGRGRRRKNAKPRTEVISKHELRLSTNLHPKQERGSWMTISHSPFIIRSSQAWWPVIRHYYHWWRRYWFDFKDVFKGILWGEGRWCEWASGIRTHFTLKAQDDQTSRNLTE